MEKLRTPDQCFDQLPGFPFAPHNHELDDFDGGSIRLHYLDEGQGPVVLCLHGEPSWCYLYRKMIPVLVEKGFRVLAPDLIGFGRSDKPTKLEDHTYARHVGWISQWLKSIEVGPVHMICQDWGGLIGLRVAAENPELFDRIVVANTGLPTGDQKMPEAFFQWRETSKSMPIFKNGAVVRGGCVRPMEPDVVKAYDAPFPDESYKAGPRIMPSLVPATPDDPAAPANRAAWGVFQQWKKPFLTAFSDKDPITAGAERVFQKLIPGAQGQPHTTIQNAGHFLQEDAGEELAEVAARFFG